MTAMNWQTNGTDGSEISEVIDFGLVDAKGRTIGVRLTVQRNVRRFYHGTGCTVTDLGSFSYSIWTTRNGHDFGALPRETGEFATIEDAKAASMAAAERSRKSQTRKYGTARA